jgi:hypothetical protein
MKTKTTNPTKIGEKTNTRNFFQKTFIVLAVLTFIGLASKSHAQIQFDYNVNNLSSCDFIIKVYDSGGNQLGTNFLSLASSGITNKSCFTSGLVTVNRIDITRVGCTTESFFATTTTSGVITYSSIIPITCNPSCSINMTCAGGGGGTQCGGTNDFHYLIEIF